MAFTSGGHTPGMDPVRLANLDTYNQKSHVCARDIIIAVLEISLTRGFDSYGHSVSIRSGAHRNGDSNPSEKIPSSSTDHHDWMLTEGIFLSLFGLIG